MARIAYVNGRYVSIDTPAVAIEDRGYQFADGIYEVCKVVRGRFCDLERHLDRLERSLDAMGMPMPMSRRALALVMEETWRRNALPDAVIYLQVSRGTAPRNHAFGASMRPSLVVTVRAAKFPSGAELEKGVGVISLPDERWANCHIKSISLLPNILAKQQAAKAGCREAWLLDEQGRVTEGSSSNAWIVDGEGRLVTRPLGREILGGITRSVVIELAKRDGIEVVERAFTLEEAKAAREAFLTSTTSLVLPVTAIDGTPVANGHPGSVTRRLAELYAEAEGMATAA
ncbi:D-amino-acid transaminase [Marinimicrococcus flavescens]|uniref:Probable branched-chain-amino-acid aminotransferase n=1 Tax=Marinimicrococcus flavescens TaxID=3031815 RepID=A0AAP3XSE8_9PROT|nr:D-amino-acid transaminase [Marinimicrococcus flavescens]